MFKSAATKIAHNTTIPALAGNSDLRPLQDLITAEKTVLMTLQKLKVDLAKAGDTLRIWGQGEGDDLGDILAASSTVLALFATALSTYSSLHQTIRDSMKSVRTREEALDELRRRRRRVGASADAAEKKLNKMSPEHKNLGIQTDILNKLRDEMRALDGEIIHEEAELGDYKRKCTKDWMGFKFGGLVECCEKGAIVGDIGRQIIQSIPEDITQPGLPRAYYGAHGRVGDLVVEAQRAVSQVTFSGLPSGRIPTAAPLPQLPPPTSQEPPIQSPFLPTPSLGSELTLGVAMYNPPPGPPPTMKRASVDELGAHAPPARPAAQFPSLPTDREREPVPVSSSVGPAQPLSVTIPYNGGAVRTEENQSLMASIADALSQSHRGFSLEETTTLGPPTLDEPAPKYECIAGNMTRSAQSEPHGPVTNGHVSSPPITEEGQGHWTRRATRRSTSPPNLPPGAAPAAIRAWDDRMGQGEDGAHSDRPASSAHVPSQPLISSSERDGEEEDGLAYERESRSFDEEDWIGTDGKHREEDALSEGKQASVDAAATDLDEQGTTSIRRSISTGAASNVGDPMPLSRASSQWRIPRVAPPPVDPDAIDSKPTAANKRGRQPRLSAESAQGSEEIGTNVSTDERAHHEAAAREVSRAMDALEFSAVAPTSTSSAPSGYTTPRGPPPGYGSALAAQTHVTAPQTRASPSQSPPSPIMPPNPPFANRGWGVEGRPLPGHHRVASEGIPGRLPTPVPAPPNTSSAGGAGEPTGPRSTSPMFRSTPPDYPRPTPPFSSPLMASSTSSLNGATSPGGGPRTISAAAFRRPQMRSPSVTESGPADTSPLTLRKPSVSPSASMSSPPVSAPVPAPAVPPKARLSVVNPDPRMSDEEEEGREEYDYIEEYGSEGAGYAAGRYVSDLEGP